VTTIIIRGSHFVGEKAGATPAPSRRRGKQELWEFEDFTDLELTRDQLRREKELSDAEWDKLRNYLYFWAKVRRYENNSHQAEPWFSPCPSCGICRCDSEPKRFWCLCASGQKMISPYRIAFVNSAEKKARETSVWEIGRGWTPKKNQATKYALGARGLD